MVQQNPFIDKKKINKIKNVMKERISDFRNRNSVGLLGCSTIE